MRLRARGPQLPRTPYRPGGTPPHSVTGSGVTGTHTARGTTYTWVITAVLMYSSNHATICVQPVRPRPSIPTCVQVDAVLTCDGLTITTTEISDYPGLVGAVAEVVSDLEICAYLLHNEWNRMLGAGGKDTQGEWPQRLRRSADVLTLTDPLTRAATWAAVQAGHTGPLEDLRPVLDAALHPPCTEQA